MNKVAHSFKFEANIFEALDKLAGIENRSANNFAETAIAIVLALIKSGAHENLSDLMRKDKDFQSIFNHLTKGTPLVLD